MSVDVNATCTQTGTIGNGYYPGQVNDLTDPFPYNYSIENTPITQGGADIEDQEDFRERTHIAPEIFSSSGSYWAYIYWAKTASQLINHVSVVTPSPGVVEIIPLLKNVRSWLKGISIQRESDGTVYIGQVVRHTRKFCIDGAAPPGMSIRPGAVYIGSVMKHVKRFTIQGASEEVSTKDGNIQSNQDHEARP